MQTKKPNQPRGRFGISGELGEGYLISASSFLSNVTMAGGSGA